MLNKKHLSDIQSSSWHNIMIQLQQVLVLALKNCTTRQHISTYKSFSTNLNNHETLEKPAL